MKMANTPTYPESILEFLQRLRREAIERGEHPNAAMRNTRQIAEHLGVSIPTVRKRLALLERERQIVGYDSGASGGGGSRPIDWGLIEDAPPAARKGL